jgi:putative flippase GtrA
MSVATGQFPRFAIVGVAATLTHGATGAVLIMAGIAPLSANLGAFIAAFGISFLGHHFYSFRGHGLPAIKSLTRFVWVAVLGFLCNQALLAVLLVILPNAPIPALILSTAAAAVLTYIFSKNWAFQRHGQANTVIAFSSP